MDNLTAEQRRKNMQHIKNKNTKIELILRKALYQKGYRYRINYKALPGTPDIVFTKYHIAIFCDGEFFHGYDWLNQRPRIEKGNNSDYWLKKIERNRERDQEVNATLQHMGWTVIRFSGRFIKKRVDECVRIIESEIAEKNSHHNLLD